MATVTRDAVVATLTGRGVARDRAVQYADQYATYHEAQENISKNGAVVANPRTGAPLINPYLAIRDRALGSLRLMQDIDATGLWE